MRDDRWAMSWETMSWETAGDRLSGWLGELGEPLFWAERIVPGALFLLMGGLLGSFLNVVAYRLPRGRSVSGRRSHCPSCGTVVRSRDNLPVLGWLILRGRCRSCRGPISVRYPLVEAGMALAVLALAAGELLTNGENLPGAGRGFPGGLDLVFVRASWDVMVIFAWHVLVTATLIVWSLFAIDGHRPSPLRITGVIAALGSVGVVMPTLLPLDLDGTAGWQASQPFLPRHGLAAMIAAVGGSAGAIGGLIPAMTVAPRTAAWPWIAGGAVFGAVVGWQGAIAHSLLGLGLGVAWCGTCCLLRWRKGCRLAVSTMPFAAVLVIVFCHRLVTAAADLPFAHSILVLAPCMLFGGHLPRLSGYGITPSLGHINHRREGFGERRCEPRGQADSAGSPHARAGSERLGVEPSGSSTPGVSQC